MKVRLETACGCSREMDLPYPIDKIIHVPLSPDFPSMMRLYGVNDPVEPTIKTRHFRLVEEGVYREFVGPTNSPTARLQEALRDYLLWDQSFCYLESLSKEELFGILKDSLLLVNNALAGRVRVGSMERKREKSVESKP